jgi:hypothetical protein
MQFQEGQGEPGLISAIISRLTSTGTLLGSAENLGLPSAQELISSTIGANAGVKRGGARAGATIDKKKSSREIGPSYNPFAFGRSDAMPTRSTVPFEVLRASWWAEDMRRFIEENNLDAIKMYLQHLVTRTSGRLPTGVFKNWPPKMGKPGRRTSSGRMSACEAWKGLGEPYPIPGNLLRKVARSVYGAEYSKASGHRRKQLHDNCRKNINREHMRQGLQELAALEKASQSKKPLELKAAPRAPQLPT